MKQQPPRSILITGASSGLGESLALSYAGPGVTLFLSGRDADRLEQVAQDCRNYSATVETKVLDVTDAAAMAEWVLAADAKAPLDLVIANAGIGAGTASGDEPAQQVRQVFSVNIDGVVNTLTPIIPSMRAKKSGHLVIMSSLASFMGLAGAPAYSASKAAVRAWGEGLRGWLASDNVTVSVICPGFVTTRMTATNDYHMPFLMDCRKATHIMRRGLDRGQARIAFPLAFYLMIRLAAALPTGLRDLWAKRLPKKA